MREVGFGDIGSQNLGFYLSRILVRSMFEPRPTRVRTEDPLHAGNVFRATGF